MFFFSSSQSIRSFQPPAVLFNASEKLSRTGFGLVSKMLMVITSPSRISTFSRGSITPLENLALIVFPIFIPPFLLEGLVIPLPDLHFRRWARVCQRSPSILSPSIHFDALPSAFFQRQSIDQLINRIFPFPTALPSQWLIRFSEDLSQKVSSPHGSGKAKRQLDGMRGTLVTKSTFFYGYS